MQVAVDSKHHLMVEQEVTNAVIDSSQLFFMAQKAKEILGKEQIDVLADVGYYHGAEIKACEEAGMEFRRLVKKDPDLRINFKEYILKP